MTRLIDADAIPWLSDYKYPHVEGFQTVRKMAIDNMPTVDAEPVRHGYWIQPEFKSIWNNKLIVCSECGELFLVQHVESEHYCRNCGAKMDGGEDEREID